MPAPPSTRPAPPPLDDGVHTSAEHLSLAEFGPPTQVKASAAQKAIVMARHQEPIPVPTAEGVARAAMRRPIVATRYPRIHFGEQLAARVLSEVLMRFGVPRSELAADLGVSPNLVGEWCRGQRAMPYGAILAIKNRRLRETLLRAGEHESAAANDNREQP